MNDRPAVVIVGNGPGVLKYELGSAIDNFDVVVRINNYQLSGYEQHVGTRTTMWARNQARNVPTLVCSDNIDVLLCMPRWAIEGSLAPWVRLRRSWNDYSLAYLRRCYSGAEVVPPSTLSRIEQSMGIHDNIQAWPSTGLVVIAWAVERYGGVCIHGFDHFLLAGGVQHHYFSRDQRPRPTLEHLRNLERRYVDNLCQEGLVRRLATDTSRS